MNAYLVEFEYEEYCQGYEWVHTMVLVNSCCDFDDARYKISVNYRNAKNFINKTIE
jgi:hypothetical protein